MSPTVVWLGWLVLFLVYELYAAVAPPLGDTLSENVWDWFGVRSKRPYSTLRRLVLAVFMVTLTLHFVFGAPGGGWIMATGAPVAAVVLYATFREGTHVR